MPAPLSLDLRKRIVEARDLFTYEQLAEVFDVGRATVSRLLRRQRETGGVEPDQLGGVRGPLLIEEEDLPILKSIVDDNPDKTLEELVDIYQERTGVRVSTSTMGRALQRVNMTRKKTFRAEQQEKEEVVVARQEWEGLQQSLNAEDLVFIDETGSNAAMTTQYARSEKGSRVYDTKPVSRGGNVTIIGALTLSGLDAMMTIEGGVGGDVFKAYVEQVLVPTLRKGQIIVMDNVRFHKVEGIEEAIEAAGCKVAFLPAYSPEFNPIEECWSKVKNLLRKARPRSFEAINNALADIIDCIRHCDAAGWFAHAGYEVN
jgi:transposase